MYLSENLPSNNLSFRMVHIPGGEFLMGSEEGDKEARDNEKPAHLVHLDDFYLGEFLVTQDIWMALMDKNRSRFLGARRPVEKVSWDDIHKLFLPKLNYLSGGHYRLPTEAEWEYAAKGGPYRESCQYAGSNVLDEVGWYHKNSHAETHEVGLLQPNKLGLYDMSGNLWEWCVDRYWAYPSEFQINPQGVEEDDYRVIRGGSWYGTPLGCRVACRALSRSHFRENYIGFRLALQ